MSLTLFIDKKKKSLGVVKWFLDPNYGIAYPTDPIKEIDFDEFRRDGVTIVRSHFEEFRKRRVHQKDVIPVFDGIESKKYLKNRIPLAIDKNSTTGSVVISPLRFKNYSLGGLQSLDPEYCKAIPSEFTEREFWQAFDMAMLELE